MIMLTSKVLEVTEIVHKTKSSLFCDLVVGDKIQLSVPVKRTSRGRSLHATYIKVVNLKTNECKYDTFTLMSNALSNFKFVEIE